MRNNFTKISLFILIGVIVCACNTIKRVPDGKNLLMKNEILVNSKKEKAENITNLLYQKPNSQLLGYRLRLNFYNLAKLNHDSIYKAKFINNPEKYKRKSKWLSAKQVNRLGHSFWYAGIHDFLRDSGEPPVLVDQKSTEKSANRLKSYYYHNGFFNAKTKFSIDSLQPKKQKINYFVTTGNAFFIDSLKTTIQSPVLDSLYLTTNQNSFIKSGKQYKTENFENERNRLTTSFRNNGVFHFQQNYVNFVIDTLNSNFKTNVELKINDFSYREGDSTKTKPFKIFKISEVNIYTDYATNKKNLKNTDSIQTEYKNFNLFSASKLKYKPKAITDAVFINKGGLFSDENTTLTTRYLSNLKIFNYPTIQYTLDKKDTINNSLIASIYLTPRKKFSFHSAFDFTRSNIQDFGISGSASILIRNIFNRAETLEIGARGNIGASNDNANPNNNFFNVSEYGLDMKLNFPRVLMFFNTDKIIRKRMIPSTTISLGFAKQKNIGLDKENFAGSMSYNWTPRINTSARYDLFNVQYVKNINVGNYFKVYGSSYKKLDEIAKNPIYNVDSSYFDAEGNLKISTGTDAFINNVLGSTPSIFPSDTDKKTIRSISQRKNRLTENNLIFASSFTFSKSTKTDNNDDTFYAFKSKIESAGNILSLISSASNKIQNQNGNNTIFEVEYSQYIKGEIEYIKHWDLRHKKVFAFRTFVGIAIPYGNSTSIPFSRSYFGGGSNDNRGWQSYSLGPGSSSAVNDFNEANLKIALSTEYRFNFFGKFNGALFIDAGNIWNVLDNVDDEKAIFSGIKSLKDTAVGTGLGFRYDFNFFVLRLDLGFKTFNPAKIEGEKWFKELNFSKSVINIGINYPF